MEYIYTFAEIGGPRHAATCEPDGGNLPGGSACWQRLAKMRTSEMHVTSGVVGMGNAGEILARVKAAGCYLTSSEVTK